MSTITTRVEPVVTAGRTTGLVGTIEIDNPRRRNAMTAAMYAAIPERVASLTADPELRSIVLRGAGDEAFCAGSDISEFRERRMGDAAASYDRAEHLAWDALAEVQVPTIAVIHGHCRGGGVALALHCDLRIAADSSVFAVPPANLGLSYPPEATRRLIAAIGPSWTKRLLFTAETIDAPTALRIGLVDEIVPAPELDRHTKALTETMAGKAPLSQFAAKAVVDAVAAHATADHLPLHELSPTATDAVTACLHSDDFQEGVRAFGEKRPPRFRGR